IPTQMDTNSRAHKLTSVVAGSLDQETAASDELARQAHHSRTHFFRLFRALIDETPGAMRRRLLLERAAWQLHNSNQTVTAIAFDAGYQSLEAFTRAFRKAFRISPSLYRRMGVSHTRLPAPNGYHFCAPGSRSEGDTMNLYDLFAGHDSWHTRRLLEAAKTLTDEQLDKPLRHQTKLLPWEAPEQNLREILERIVFTKEVWTAALTGGELPATSTQKASPASLLARLEKVDAAFHGVLSGVSQRGAWGDTFVDALCQPPETFTFGGMFAHVMTFNGYRRLTATDALRGLGVEIEGFGCPTEYEASLNSAPAKG
ncbi:MAG: helix-turn-helix domain-containing protein, partial [Bryobacterales bacterium]|nr:helix-turn-helix domain-containing protein [Bryobacterales bacterium]